MLAAAFAALAGRPVMVMLPVARASFVLVGVLLGAVVTPEMVRGIANWPASVAILVVSALAMFFATACYLRFVHGWEPLSALLGASPGSMAQVMALSAEFNADLRGIAVVQVMRVLLIVIGLPAGLALVRARRSTRCAERGADIARRTRGAAHCVGGGSGVFQRLRFPRRPHLRRAGRIGGLARHRSSHRATAVVARQRRDRHPRRGCGLALCQYQPADAARLFGRSDGSFAVATIVAACFALLVVAFLPFRLATSRSRSRLVRRTP